MPFTEAQLTVLEACDEEKQGVENAIHEYNQILRAAHRWHDGTAGFLVPDDLTDTEVVAKFCAKANACRAKVIAAAQAMREV